MGIVNNKCIFNWRVIDHWVVWMDCVTGNSGCSISQY